MDNYGIIEAIRRYPSQWFPIVGMHIGSKAEHNKRPNLMRDCVTYNRFDIVYGYMWYQSLWIAGTVVVILEGLERIVENIK